MKQLIAVIFFLFSSFNIASAATVDPTNSAVFSFDISSLGAGDTINSWGYYSTNSTAADNLLSVGASTILSFGSSAGSNDIYTHEYTNRFSFDIWNVAQGLSPIALPASLDLLYVTVSYVDDIFSLDRLSLYTSQGNIYGTYEGSISAVPLPAAAWFFGTALLAFAGFSRKKKTV